MVERLAQSMRRRKITVFPVSFVIQLSALSNTRAHPFNLPLNHPRNLRTSFQEWRAWNTHPRRVPPSPFDLNESRIAMSNLKRLGISLALVALGAPGIPSANAEDGAVIAPLISKDLVDIPGKEMLMITVTYPPGYAGSIHRHDAHSFIYVLEGSVVMGVKGGKEVTLKPGQTFYEGPADVHTVGRNASTTQPAKLVVVLVKKNGADVVLPAE
jgi:quercetin dioxygenase-like cupin family protein